MVIMGKFVLDVKEWRMDCLMFGGGWDSSRKKCVVTDCKLEKHKLPLIDHKLSKTVESGDSPDTLESVESMESLCLEGEGALRLKLNENFNKNCTYAGVLDRRS